MRLIPQPPYRLLHPLQHAQGQGPLRPAQGAWWNLVVEVTVLQPCELVTEVQFTAKEEDSDPVIRRIAEPSGSSFQGLDFTIEPLTDRIGNPV